MTAAKSEFRRYVEKNEALPKDVMLGYIVWFTIPDGAYNIQDISDTFDRLQLDSRFVPEPTSAFNAFEKSCSNALKVAQPYQLPQNRIGQIMAIREAHKTNEKVIQHIVREVRDSRRARLRYEPVAEIALFREKLDGNNRIVRGTGNVRANIFTPVIEPGEEPYIDAVIQKQRAEFNRLYNFADGDKTRKIVRDYVGFLNGIMMKSSVYFIHVNQTSQLDKLQEFVASLGNGCSMELMDLPDLGKLRTSVVAAYQEQAKRDLAEVVKAIAKIRSTRGVITMAAYQKIKAQYEDVMRHSLEHMRTFKVSQDLTASAAEDAMDMLLALESDMRRQMEA